MDITQYLSKECVLIREDAIDRNRALELLISAADKAGKLTDKLRFAETVASRELIVSTGVGLGVAVPHAKQKGQESFFIAVGIFPQGVDWDAIDGKPVSLVFLIGGPENRQREYLHILARIVEIVKHADKRDNLRRARSPEQVLSLLSS